MGYRHTIKKQRQIMRKKLEEMAAVPIAKNKLVKARRQGWLLGAIMGGLTGGLLAAAIGYGIKLIVRHP